MSCGSMKGGGPKLFTLKKGGLSQYGYSSFKSSSLRHKALDMGVKKEGVSKIVKRLNALSIVTKNTSPKLHSTYESDIKYIQKNYERKSSGRRSMSGGRRSSSCERNKIAKVMGEYKRGSLRSGGRTPVRNRNQAIAIALSESRRYC